MKHVPRLFINVQFKPNLVIKLGDFDQNHIINVLRKKDGDECYVFNRYEEWLAKLRITKKEIVLVIYTLIRRNQYINFYDAAKDSIRYNRNIIDYVEILPKTYQNCLNNSKVDDKICDISKIDKQNFDDNCYIKNQDVDQNMLILPNNIELYVFFSTFKRQEMLFEKIVEIGANYIIPVKTDFSWNSNNFNYEKSWRIIKGALEQSNRFGDINLVRMIDFDDLLHNNIFDDMNMIMLIEREKSANFIQLLESKCFFEKIKKSRKISIFIGPEGGFSERELKIISQIQHIFRVSLGNNILRSETAGIVASGIIKNYLSIFE